MNRSSILAALLLTLAPFGAGALPPSSDYQLIWHDEFEGSALNRQAWSYRTTAKWDTAHRPDNVVVSNHLLRLVLEEEANDGKPFTTGGVVSKLGFRYGYFEARWKGWPDPNWHPSFWTAHALANETLAGLPARPDLGGSEAPRLEIDIAEHDTIDVFEYHAGVIRWGPQGQQGRGRQYFSVPDLSADFHVFGCEVTPHQVAFYFDGVLKSTVPISDFPQPEGFAWLTSIGRDIDPTNLPGTIDFDYFRFYSKPDLVPPEFKLVNAASGRLLQIQDLGVLADTPLEVGNDASLFRRDAWQWIETSPGQARLRSSWSSLTLTGTGAEVGSGHLVVADFNDLGLGPMREADGQPPGTGIGFGDAYWRVNTSIPRIADGDLAAPAATQYAIVQPGTGSGQAARSVIHSSFADPRNQGRELATALAGEVWFSFLVEPRDPEDRLGVMFNNTSFSYTADNHSIYCVGDALHVDTEDGSTTYPGAFTLGTTSLVVGRLSIDRGLAVQDHLEVWINPVLQAGQALGPPLVDQELAMLPGDDRKIHTVHVVAYGQVTESGRLDALRLSDNPGLLGLTGGSTGSVALVDITGIAAYQPPLPVPPTTLVASTFGGANPNQEFETLPAGGDTVYLRHLASGQYLVAGATTNSAPVGLGLLTGDGRDRWTLRSANPVEQAFPGASPQPQNWYWTWMGFVFAPQYPWLYHRELGWLAVAESGGAEAWVHHPLFGWLGSTPELYPLVYSQDQAAWGLLEFDDAVFEVRLILYPGGTILPGGFFVARAVDLQAVIEAADYRTLSPPPVAPPGAFPADPGIRLADVPPPPGAGRQLMLLPVSGENRFFLGLRGMPDAQYRLQWSSGYGSWQDVTGDALSVERLRFLTVTPNASHEGYRAMDVTPASP